MISIILAAALASSPLRADTIKFLAADEARTIAELHGNGDLYVRVCGVDKLRLVGRSTHRGFWERLLTGLPSETEDYLPTVEPAERLRIDRMLEQSAAHNYPAIRDFCIPPGG